MVRKNGLKEWSYWYSSIIFKALDSFNVHDLAFSLHSLTPCIQSPASRIQGPASSVQSPVSRVQRPESSIQSPVSNTCVQSPGIPVCHYWMCIGASILRKRSEIETKIFKNSGDRYCNMIPHIKETVIRVRMKHCDLSSRMHYLKFTCK